MHSLIYVHSTKIGPAESCSSPTTCTKSPEKLRNNLIKKQVERKTKNIMEAHETGKGNWKFNMTELLRKVYYVGVRVD